MEILLENIFNVILVAIIYTFLVEYFGFKVRSGLIKTCATAVACTLSFFILYAVSNDVPLEITSDIILTAIAAVFCVTMLNGQKYEMIFICFFMLSVNVLNTVMTAFIFSVLRGSGIYSLFETFDLLRMLAILLSQIILFAITRLMLHFKHHVELVFRDFFTLLILPVFSILIMTLLLSKGRESVNAAEIYMFTMLVVVFMNVITYILFMIISRRNILNENYVLLKIQNDSERKRMKEVEMMYDEIRKMRHDIKNHTECIRTMAYDMKCNEIIEYIDNYVSNAEYIRKKFVFTGDRVLDAIINTKFTAAEKAGVTHNAQIDRNIKLPMKDVDITTLLGNLLDNAIEAASEAPGGNICLRSYKKGDMIYISVSNTISKPVLAVNPELRSTKKDSGLYGLGVTNIRRIVDNYGGMIKFDESDRLFECSIAIPCPDSTI